MRVLLPALAILLLASVPPAAAQATCTAGHELCVGEATQACGGPSVYGEGWVGFTGAWGQTGGWEYGAGGWEICEPGHWSAGAFVNADSFPLGRYETVQVRYDWSPSSSRPCYLSAGAYGWFTYYGFVACIDEDTFAPPVPDPGWGRVLP